LTQRGTRRTSGIAVAQDGYIALDLDVAVLNQDEQVHRDLLVWPFVTPHGVNALPRETFVQWGVAALEPGQLRRGHVGYRAWIAAGAYNVALDTKGPANGLVQLYLANVLLKWAPSHVEL
jgi:hypothetical protein